jgi:hypothetical protein
MSDAGHTEPKFEHQVVFVRNMRDVALDAAIVGAVASATKSHVAVGKWVEQRLSADVPHAMVNAALIIATCGEGGETVLEWVAGNKPELLPTEDQSPASPWDDPAFSLSGGRADSVYRTRGFIDTAA